MPPATRRRFFAGLNLFAWSMAMAPLVNGLALLWVAIEVTTVISALLVAIDDTDGAIEAAWKYVLIASMGLGIALLATLVMYYAGTSVLGSSYELFYPKLLGAAHGFPPEVVRLSFVLAVLGFGTKMGLVPVHTWLPDAHSEAPTPISALLSGAAPRDQLLRHLALLPGDACARVGPAFPRNVLLVFGLASLVLAALYLASQTRPEAVARLLERGAHGHPRHRDELLGARSPSSECSSTSSPTPPPRRPPSSGPGASSASSARRTSTASAAASALCRGAARCSSSPSWHCPPCRRSASSGVSS